MTIPIVGAKTVVEYYSGGTIYQNTSSEFKESLWKNLVMAVNAHMLGSFDKSDLKFFVNRLMWELMDRCKTQVLVREALMGGFGQPFSERSAWVVQGPPGPQAVVLLYLHGGGYAVSLLVSQIMGMLVIHHALPDEVRNNVSILVLDYSTTVDNCVYPTQIYETLIVYQQLVRKGYKNIVLLGDSAGGNLALSVTRFLAYRKEGEDHFGKFPIFRELFKADLPQPYALILVSPWVEPLKSPQHPPKGVDVRGDLLDPNSPMGHWYVEGVNLENAENWFSFGETSFNEHWQRIDAFRKQNRCLVLYGDREYLRNGIEEWLSIVSQGGGVQRRLEKGGIHDCVFFVEVIDFMGRRNSKQILRAVSPIGIKNKFGFSNIVSFLGDIAEEIQHVNQH